MGLFPRGLFEDALPPIALKSQVYSLVPDRTAADRQLVRGARATDLSGSTSHSASVRFFLCQALQCYKPCKKILGSRERANFGCERAKLLGKLDCWTWLEFNTAGNTGRCQITTGLVHQYFHFTLSW